MSLMVCEKISNSEYRVWNTVSNIVSVMSSEELLIARAQGYPVKVDYNCCPVSSILEYVDFYDYITTDIRSVKDYNKIVNFVEGNYTVMYIAIKWNVRVDHTILLFVQRVHDTYKLFYILYDKDKNWCIFDNFEFKLKNSEFIRFHVDAIFRAESLGNDSDDRVFFIVSDIKVSKFTGLLNLYLSDCKKGVIKKEKLFKSIQVIRFVPCGEYNGKYKVVDLKDNTIELVDKAVLESLKLQGYRIYLEDESFDYTLEGRDLVESLNRAWQLSDVGFYSKEKDAFLYKKKYKLDRNIYGAFSIVIHPDKDYASCLWVIGDRKRGKYKCGAFKVADCEFGYVISGVEVKLSSEDFCTMSIRVETHLKSFFKESEECFYTDSVFSGSSFCKEYFLS